MSATFEFGIVIGKTDDGVMRFRGVASSTGLDRQEDTVTEKALTSMAAQVPIALTAADSHQAAMVNPMGEVGVIDALYVEDDKLCVEGGFDETHPWAVFLYKKVGEGNQKLSIGGHIPPDAIKTEFADDGVPRRSINDVLLNHILLCRAGSAANQDTEVMAATADWVEEICKAVPELVDEVTKTWGGLSVAELRTKIYDVIVRPDYECYIVALYEKHVIIAVGSDTYKAKFTVSGDGEVELEEYKEVTLEWVAAALADDTDVIWKTDKTLTAPAVDQSSEERSMGDGTAVEALVAALDSSLEHVGSLVDKVLGTADPAEEVVEEEPATEEPEAEKSEVDTAVEAFTVSFNAKMDELFASIDDRITKATEEPVVEETVAEEAQVEEPVEEQETATEEAAEEVAEETATEELTEEPSLEQVVERIGHATIELQTVATSQTEKIDALVTNQAEILERLDKTAPQSKQAVADRTQHTQESADDDNPIQFMVDRVNGIAAS